MSDEESIYSENTTSTDLLDDFLDRYSITFKPDYILKLRKCFGQIIVGPNFNISHPDLLKETRFVVKPANKALFIQKLLVTPRDSDARLYSRKINLGEFFRLQVVAGHDFNTRRSAVLWSLTTKWSAGKRVGRKEKYQVLDGGLRLSMPWTLDLHSPELEGTFGTGALAPAAHLDRGHCYVDVPKVNAVLDFDQLVGFGRNKMRERRECANREAERLLPPPEPPAPPVSAFEQWVQKLRGTISAGFAGNRIK